MADSKRQQIITALDARLKTIKTVNGYETNLGDNVFELRPAPLQDSELPGVVYYDTNETHDIAVQTHIHTISINMDVITSGATTIATVRKMIADIIKAVGVDVTFGNLAEDSRILSDDIKIEHESKLIGGALIKMEIEYTTNTFNPYA